MTQAQTARDRSLVISGLGGNDLYCLRRKGFRPGQLLVGNSVQSRGLLGSLSSGARNLAGGESPDVTALIKDGRDAALSRLMTEAVQTNATGIANVWSEVTFFDGHLEFLATGSGIHSEEGRAEEFSTSFDAKELYCMLDAGYQPRKFAFGNIAYSVGLGGSLMASFRSLGRGEIPEISGILNKTRHAALNRLIADARSAGANAVVGVETDMLPFLGFHEMLMTGTAAYHPGLKVQMPVTCDLTSDELWSLTQMGMAPVKIVMGAAVYSLGVAGGLKTWLQSFKKGELNELTRLVYEAREHALDMVEQEALSVGADAVMGTDVYVNELASGILEFMAIGTAVRNVSGLSTAHEVLPAQAVSHHRTTFRNSVDYLLSGSLQSE
jgi:uncharacterized protein YbjQ (UPF0145 family)